MTTGQKAREWVAKVQREYGCDELTHTDVALLCRLCLAQMDYIEHDYEAQDDLGNDPVDAELWDALQSALEEVSK